VTRQSPAIWQPQTGDAPAVRFNPRRLPQPLQSGAPHRQPRPLPKTTLGRPGQLARGRRLATRGLGYTRPGRESSAQLHLKFTKRRSVKLNLSGATCRHKTFLLLRRYTPTPPDRRRLSLQSISCLALSPAYHSTPLLTRSLKVKRHGSSTILVLSPGFSRHLPHHLESMTVRIAAIN